MSPQSPRIPTPSVGDDNSSGGRHRRPESLADVSVRSGPRVAVMSSVDRPTRSARHQRPTNGPRHAVRVPAQRRPRNRPTTTGSHRAPGTLPIESWLLMGKKRQQALLASLVAIGIVLLAMPAQQRRDSFDAVNAAAQAVVGVQASKKTPQAAPPPAAPERDETTPVKDEAPAKVEPTPTTTATKAPPPPAEASEAPSNKKDKPAGPGQSLRTTGSEVVALTFDDGPDPVQTPRILELLGKYQVKAVFCLVGTQVQRHPEIVRQIVAEGHTLCNHTWDHSLTIGKDKPAKIKADLDRTNAAILAAVPDAKIPFFRAPGGNFTDRLVGVAGSGGMTSLYWEVDPRDWEHPEKETDAQHVDRMIADVRKQVKPGSIVLSHDFNQPTTITAYEKLLPWLVENFKLGIPAIADPATPPAPSTPPTSAPLP